MLLIILLLIMFFYGHQGYVCVCPTAPILLHGGDEMGNISGIVPYTKTMKSPLQSGTEHTVVIWL